MKAIFGSAKSLLARRVGLVDGDTAPFPRVHYFPRSTFAEAACEAGVGYQNPILVEGCNNAAADFRIDRLGLIPGYAAALFATIGMIGKSTIAVADVGGALGGHFFWAESAFPAIAFDWHVVETPLYVERGREMFLNGNLSFLTVFPKQQLDLAYFSGSLPYIDDWKAAIEDARSAEYILITRTRMSDREMIYLQETVYASGRVAYPCRVFARADITECLGRSHAVIAAWDNLGDGVAELWRRSDARQCRKGSTATNSRS